MTIIKNMLFTSSVANNPVDMQCRLDFQPDEAIVRQITFASPAASSGVYLLWCSLINDYIGAFHNQTLGTISYPNMKIDIKGVVPNSLQFRVEVAGSGIVSGLPAGTTWAVQIDFIKH